MKSEETVKIIGILNEAIGVMDKVIAEAKKADEPPEGLENQLGSLRYDIELVMGKLRSASVDFSRTPPFVQGKTVPRLVSKKK